MVVVTIKNRLFDEIALFMPLYRFRREALVPAGKGRYSDFNQLLMDPDLRFAILPRAAFLFTPEEAQRLQKVLDEIRRDGTLKRFLARYSKRAPEVPADL